MESFRVSVFLYRTISSDISFSLLIPASSISTGLTGVRTTIPHLLHILVLKKSSYSTTRIVNLSRYLFTLFLKNWVFDSCVYTKKSGFLRTCTKFAKKKIRTKHWSGDGDLDFPVSHKCKSDVIVSPSGDVNGSFWNWWLLFSCSLEKYFLWLF